MRTITMTAVPLAIAFALAAPLAIHLLWHGKWDMATRATQILAACVPAWLLIHCTRALLEARGYWRLRFALLAINGAGGITAAALGTLSGTIEGIAIVVATFYATLSLCIPLALVRLGLNIRDGTTLLVKPLVLNGVALGLSLAAPRWIPLSGLPLQVIPLALFLVLAGIVNWIAFAGEWGRLLEAFATRRASASAAEAEPARSTMEAT